MEASEDLPNFIKTESIKALSCEECGHTFNKPSKLLAHIKSVHQNERPFACDQCTDTFKRKDHLNRHITSKHAEQRNLLDCPDPDCLMSFPNKDQLQKHISRAHEKVNKL
jgi:uncharacterized Zn-finger protein